MGQTFFQNFTRDNGRPVTVEYSYGAGSETTYSPMNGACGGDGCEVEILSSWPNTATCERLARIQRALEWPAQPTPLLQNALVAWTALPAINLAIWIYERFYQLSDTERERMEAWIAEHHVYEPYEEDYF